MGRKVKEVSRYAFIAYLHKKMSISYKQDYGNAWEDAMGIGRTDFGGGGGGGAGALGLGGGALGGLALGAGALGALATGANQNRLPSGGGTTNNHHNNQNNNAPPIILDKTDENIGTEIVTPLSNYFEEARKYRDEEWAREDQIRKETQEREDTAYSRAIEDLRNAGVNINLLGSITPAGSGGGITNQTGSMDYTMTANEYNRTIELIMQEIDQNFKGDQAEKDRLASLIEKLIIGGSMITRK